MSVFYLIHCETGTKAGICTWRLPRQDSMQGAFRQGCHGLACGHTSQQRCCHQPVYSCSREPGAGAGMCSARLRRPVQPAPSFARVCGLTRPLQAARVRRCKPVSARYNSSPEITERLLSALPYLVPLFDGAHIFTVLCAGVLLQASNCSWPVLWLPTHETAVACAQCLPIQYLAS